jgi:glyoxylase-like metal-dependent hydrolase (beta-lactamase superfamily II)/8-oxo-dGTP pyrophosphatase MutT (NUDIX family)
VDSNAAKMVPSPSTPSLPAPIPAASVLLARGPGSAEVLLVRRNAQLRFFGGFWAFPGGKLAAEDAHTPVLGGPAEPEGNCRRAAAARELFEETGVLLARRGDGSFPQAGPELDDCRRELCAGRLLFPALLARFGLTLHAADLRPLGDITTPPFVALRFDTSFFVADLPRGQSAQVWEGELDKGRWASAAEMLACWTRGECLISPPTVMTLEAIRDRPADEAPARLAPLLRAFAAGKLHQIYFAPQVQLIPLHTETLPPSSYTNAYLVGHDPAYLIDPGPADPAEQRRLFDLLDEGFRGGLRLRAVILSHQHPDHIGAAAACAARYAVPVWAHPHTADALRGRVEVARLLRDGDRLDLGVCPAGSGSWHLEALHTPGHAAGHLAFYEPCYRLLFAGDLVSTATSIVILPPEGDLSVYLDSVRRLLAYDCRLLLPAHGGASSRPQLTLEECVAHRARREQQLLAALTPTPRSIEELTRELYKAVPAELMRLAERQLLAGLLKLQREGQAEPAGESGWRLPADSPST